MTPFKYGKKAFADGKPKSAILDEEFVVACIQADGTDNVAAYVAWDLGYAMAKKLATGKPFYPGSTEE